MPFPTFFVQAKRHQTTFCLFFHNNRINDVLQCLKKEIKSLSFFMQIDNVRPAILHNKKGVG